MSEYTGMPNYYFGKLREEMTNVCRRERVRFRQQNVPLHQLINEEIARVSDPRLSRTIPNDEWRRMMELKQRLTDEGDQMAETVCNLYKCLKTEVNTARQMELRTRIAEIRRHDWKRQRAIKKMTLNTHEQEMVWFLYRSFYPFKLIAFFLDKDPKFIRTWFYKTHKPGCDCI